MYGLRALVACLGCGLLAAAVCGAPAGARDYPAQAVKLVLGFPAGGSTDISSRRLANHLAPRLGQPVVVENRPGATANIAAAYVARSAPDGYTIFYGTNTTHAMNVSLYANLPFDPVRDFAPVVLAGKTWSVLSVHPASAIGQFSDLVSGAKAAPGAIHVATPGNSTSPHMALELLQQMAGIRLAHVPYKGSAAALTDVVGNQVSVLFDNIPASLPYIKSGKLRAIAVTSPTRQAVLPEVPTFDELGLTGYQVAGWGAVWAPAATPRPVIDRLNREINAVLKDPKMIAAMAEMASEPQGGTPEELALFAREETNKWRRVIRAAGIKLD